MGNPWHTSTGRGTGPGLVNAYEEAKTADVTRLITLIGEHDLTREMVPTEMLDNKMVLRALAEKMPMMALVRNLANLTRLGVATPMDCGWLVSKLLAAVNLNRRVIHPINVLTAMLNYRSGRSVRGSNSWGPIPRISSALDEVFYRSFDQAPQTNQRLYLGVDISASMSHYTVDGIPGLSARMAATAMVMAVVRREPNYYLAGFSTTAERSHRWGDSNMMTPLGIAAQDNLFDAMAKTDALPFGGTDCSLPMLDALEKKWPVDCFMILTDNETWAGKMHPVEALRKHRKEMGIPAKLVVGMVSNGFSIADPHDPGTLDVVGFDAAVPQLIPLGECPITARIFTAMAHPGLAMAHLYQSVLYLPYRYQGRLIIHVGQADKG